MIDSIAFVDFSTDEIDTITIRFCILLPCTFEILHDKLGPLQILCAGDESDIGIYYSATNLLGDTFECLIICKSFLLHLFAFMFRWGESLLGEIPHSPQSCTFSFYIFQSLTFLHIVHHLCELFEESISGRLDQYLESRTFTLFLDFSKAIHDERYRVTF